MAFKKEMNLFQKTLKSGVRKLKSSDLPWDLLRCNLVTPEDINACRQQQQKINKSVNKTAQLTNETQEVTEAM